jgi:uncharacterized protein (TIGR02147 family)
MPKLVATAEDTTAPNVYSFLDYRAFLRAHYEHRKGPGRLSFRAFSQRAGLRSPNYLKLVMDGQRNLSSDMAPRFARACGLTGDAERYFERLVDFNQARTVDERTRCYRKLCRERRFRERNKLGPAQDLYHSRWYLPAIRELAGSVDFRPDPEWVAARLLPPISPREAQIAIDTLIELGLLKREGKGRSATLKRGEATVSTGPEVRSLHLANFHRAMIEHARTSIDRIPVAQRDISSLTLCLGEDGLDRIKRAVQRFRRELLEIEQLEAEPRQVVQINFQLFPLSAVSPGDLAADLAANLPETETP